MHRLAMRTYLRHISRLSPNSNLGAEVFLFSDPWQSLWEWFRREIWATLPKLDAPLILRALLCGETKEQLVNLDLSRRFLAPMLRLHSWRSETWRESTIKLKFSTAILPPIARIFSRSLTLSFRCFNLFFHRRKQTLLDTITL